MVQFACNVNLLLNFILCVCVCVQKMLADVWTKFRLFQKPANFDSRLAECERVLSGVKGQMAVLDICSVEQDVVQSQLEQCMVGIHFTAGLVDETMGFKRVLCVWV